MTANEYRRAALRTESNETVILDYDGRFRLQQGLMRLCGESGEAIDLLKKSLYQGHEPGKAHLSRELWGAAWYLAIAADAIGCMHGENGDV